LATGVGSDMFVELVDGRSCDRINSVSDGDIDTGLAVDQSDFSTRGAPVSAFDALVFDCLFVEAWVAVLDAFVVLEEDFCAEAGQAA